MNNVIHIGNLSPKGQVTIPAKLRKEFALKSPSRVLFTKQDDTIVIKPLKHDITRIFDMAKKLGIKTIPPSQAEKKMKEIVGQEILQEGR